tara:strand:+ start:324 stop:1604 length:1281 start_codon:yes stop_codon:yes gene_type:complete
LNYQKIYSYLKKAFVTGSIKTIVVALTTIIFLPLIIIELGLEAYGIISLVMIFGSLVTFSDFGIAKSITMLVGHEKNKENILFSNGFYLNLIFLFLFFICTLFIIIFDFQIFGSNLQLDTNLKNGIIISGFLILSIMTLNNVLIAILEVNYLSHFVSISFMISSVLFHIFLYLFSINTDILVFIIFSPVISSLLTMVYLIYIIIKYTNIKLVKLDFTTMKYMMKSSIGFFKLSLVNSISIPSSKYLLIYLTGNTSFLAILDIAIKISQIATSFLNSISQPLFGVFSNYKDSKNEIYVFTKKVSVIIFILFIFGNGLFYFTGEYIITFIDKENYLSIFNITTIILFFITFNAISEPSYRALISQNHLNISFKLKSLVPAINFILIFTFYLYNVDSLINITWSLGISYFIGSIAIMIYFFKSKEKFVL